MIDLVGELMPCAWAMTRSPYQDEMVAAGISPIAIYGSPPRLHGHFGPGRIECDGSFFSFHPDGIEAFVMGVHEHPDEPIIDLLAFQLTNPTRLWLRHGNAVLLGQHNARLALFKEEPLFVHATPLDWLRAYCQGCVVLDWKTDLLSYLDGYGIQTADEITQRRLQRAFKRHVHIPEVRVVV